MNDSARTIARYTFLEAVNNHLFIFAILLFIGLFGLAEFVGELAITESLGIQAAITGAMLRLAAIFLTSLFVITSMVREFNDKGFELVLSLPLKRSTYYFGKLLGYAALSVVIAGLVSLPLMLYVEIGPLSFWMLSLLCELLLMTAAALLCLFTFGNVTIAFTVVMAFYFLSRTMNAIILISQSPILETGSAAQSFIGFLIRCVAVCLPDLDRFTRTEWLVYGDAGIADLLPVVIQTLVYLLLLSAAALVDLYRKNL